MKVRELPFPDRNPLGALESALEEMWDQGGHPSSDAPLDPGFALGWAGLLKKALHRRGFLVVQRDSGQLERPYIRGYNAGWDDAMDERP